MNLSRHCSRPLNRGSRRNKKAASAVMRPAAKSRRLWRRAETLERAKRIELSSFAWKAAALPLSYARENWWVKLDSNQRVFLGTRFTVWWFQPLTHRPELLAALRSRPLPKHRDYRRYSEFVVAAGGPFSGLWFLVQRALPTGRASVRSSACAFTTRLTVVAWPRTPGPTIMRVAPLARCRLQRPASWTKPPVSGRHPIGARSSSSAACRRRLTEYY